MVAIYTYQQGLAFMPCLLIIIKETLILTVILLKLCRYFEKNIIKHTMMPLSFISYIFLMMFIQLEMLQVYGSSMYRGFMIFFLKKYSGYKKLFDIFIKFNLIC
jgi:hypothetical protein